MPGRIRLRKLSGEELRLLSDGSFVGEIIYVCFAVSGSGVIEVEPGWFYCNGALADKRTLKRLFDEIGFTYSPVPGTDPGGNQFYLPDGPGRSFMAHADGRTGATRVANAGALGNATVPGAVGGADVVALGKPHLPPHLHGVGTLSVTGGAHLHGPGTIGVHQSSGDGATANARNAHDGSVAPATTVDLPVGGNVDAITHTHPNADLSGSTEDGTATGLGAGTPTHNNIPPHLAEVALIRG